MITKLARLEFKLFSKPSKSDFLRVHQIYESECKKIRKENRKILDGFRQYLGGKKISAKIIDKHASNIDFYINEFLLYEEPLKAKKGVSELNSFMGYWFIRKATWASVASIKENIASLKHFYTFMYDCNAIGLEELKDMKEEIKENKAEWLETVRKYNDPDTDFEDISIERKQNADK